MIEKTFMTFSENESTFSINLSIQDIEDEATVAFLTQQLEHYNIGKRLILEILENEDILTSNKFLGFVTLMRSYGVRFALDDFGSGYSNFSFLSQMQPKFLKIDGSLIQNINNDKNTYNIVKTLVRFAEELGSVVIAEFVEEQEIVDILNELGVEWMQGYHFAAPSPSLKW